MKKMNQKKIIAAAGMTVFVLLTGCQSASNNAETEALKEQINQLEQQIAELQQQNAAQNMASSQEPTTAAENNQIQEQAPAVDNKPQEQAPAADSTQTTSNQATTYTMEELTAMVDAYIAKANAAAPAGTSDDMETFFSLKQGEKQINDLLDIHEDELERLYHQNALSRDEYKNLEWELEKLEDDLDDAEDRLERVFGIDD
ncbi:MAG: hypothetical protein NC231_14205 [Bacillus sp. (in: Bacteria)]|nr:hypothetical protein [Bacillus sp. (in: firmicutes)]